jgi:hypothetical protein
MQVGLYYLELQTEGKMDNLFLFMKMDNTFDIHISQVLEFFCLV